MALNHKMLVDSVHDFGLFLLDGTGVIQTWNPGAKEIKGYTAEEIIGRHFSLFYEPADARRREPERNLDVARRDGVCVREGWRVRKDGSRFWAHVTIQAINDETGAVEGFAKVTRDLTEQRQAEARLKRQALIFQNLSDGVVIVEAKRIVDVNPAAETIFGRSRQDVMGRSPATLVREDDDGGRSLLQSRHWIGHIDIPREDGSERLCAVHVISVEDDDGRETARIWIVRDVTAQAHMARENREYVRTIEQNQRDLKRLSSELMEAQERERKRLSRELHDDLGQTLAAVSRNLEFIEAQLSPETAVAARQYFADTRQLVANMLARVRRLSLQLRPAMLDELGLIPALGWYIDQFEQRSGVDVTLVNRLSRPLPEEVEVALYRVVQEALTNVARHAGAQSVEVALAPTEDAVVLEIRDDGRGLPQDAPSGGAGIGLLGVRERVSLLGGRLEIASESGGGTHIAVRIPLNRDGGAG